jgi:hypothetical protein
MITIDYTFPIWWEGRFKEEPQGRRRRYSTTGPKAKTGK